MWRCRGERDLPGGRVTWCSPVPVTLGGRLPRLMRGGASTPVPYAPTPGPTPPSGAAGPLGVPGSGRRPPRATAPPAAQVPMVRVCCQTADPSTGGRTLRPRSSNQASTVSPRSVSAGTRVVAVCRVPSGSVQRTVARYACCPPACTDGSESVVPTTSARTRCRSARCSAATDRASSWAHQAAAAPARGAPTRRRTATTSTVHASTTSDRRRSGLRRQRQPRTRVRNVHLLADTAAGGPDRPCGAPPLPPPSHHARECLHGRGTPSGAHRSLRGRIHGRSGPRLGAARDGRDETGGQPKRSMRIRCTG